MRQLHVLPDEPLESLGVSALTALEVFGNPHLRAENDLTGRALDRRRESGGLFIGRLWQHLTPAGWQAGAPLDGPTASFLNSAHFDYLCLIGG